MDESPAALRPRRPWVAFVLAWVAPGLGHLYAGAFRRGLVAAIVAIFVLLPVAALIKVPLTFSPFGVVLGLVLSLLVLSVVPVDAALTARRLRDRPLRPWNRVLVYIGYAVVVSLAAAAAGGWLLGQLPFRTFKVPSGSMEDTILVGDYIIGDMRRGKLFPVRRGDVVLYWIPEKQVFYTHRVVGLPGETLWLRDGALFVDDREVEEPYVRPEFREQDLRGDHGPVTLAEGEYFVLGDHRNEAADSRSRGPIPGEQLRGRAVSIWWSIEESSSSGGFGSTGERWSTRLATPVRAMTQARWERIGRSLRYSHERTPGRSSPGGPGGR